MSRSTASSLSRKQIDELIKNVDLPDGDETKTRRFALAPKYLRLNLIRGPPSREAALCAAIEIQRHWRGYCTRCRLLSILDPKISGTAVYSGSKHHVARLQDVRTPPPQKKKMNARRRLEIKFNDSDSDTFEDFCAGYIQSWWKKGQSPPKTPSRSIQKKHEKPSIKRNPPTQKEAVIKIQRAWRRHIDVQVYKYYRDLINFKCRGDPAMMLRCINPKEAKMLDPAMGIHIKFRLAGNAFPPNIYYKIFTHRPIQDLCANSPKDYTKPSVMRKAAKDVHNKGDARVKEDKSVWYKREENNGWRLVSDRLIHHIMSDPVTWETSKKKIEFHHNKLQRKADLEKKKKKRKIDWMKQMYKEGMLKSKTANEETKNLVERATAGMVATAEIHGPDAIEEWEVDELLDWTTSLNFDDYLGEWKEIATSATSEKVIEDKRNLFNDQVDPFTISLSALPSRGKHTSTPVSAQTAIELGY
ncbi:unnamed protein product [Owenia fusiformis]|uniref:Uncharacterized protein n=1 Tax=Owenia fusiformis TaxID=6347 RepID=A0A8J1XIS2_OWEFU|nr:unnamed protein product [Owenia fusiformis]